MSPLVEPESHPKPRATLAELIRSATGILQSPIRLAVDAAHHLEFATALRAACGPAIHLPQARGIIERELDESIAAIRGVLPGTAWDEIRRQLP